MHSKFWPLESRLSTLLSRFPLRCEGLVVDYENPELTMPNKIIEMGLLPGTTFIILHQAPFRGPLYIEYGQERTRIALRVEEAEFIKVEAIR